MTSKLSDAKDEILVENIKIKSCNNSLMELITRHSGICFSMGKKFTQYGSFNLNDLNDNKDWIIYSAALSFDSDKGSKFSTWLGNQVKYYCLNLKNKSSKYIDTEDTTIEFLVNQYYNENKSNESKVQILNTIRDILDQIKDKNIKDAIHYRYFSNKERILNYSEIGDILNVTPQTVLNWHNKFIDLAKKKLTSLNNSDII
jgi:DNA-directed RNA polymerase sigma subunit (sigma70/sigma32)